MTLGHLVIVQLCLSNGFQKSCEFEISLPFLVLGIGGMFLSAFCILGGKEVILLTYFLF